MLLIDRLRRLQQDRRRLEQDRRRLEREVETLKARDAAENRAMAKLKASLTDAQWQMVEALGYFELRSNTGHRWRIKTTCLVGNTYRHTVRPGSKAPTVINNIPWPGSWGSDWKRYCAVLKQPDLGAYPIWDQYLSQALMIRTDEVTYLHTASPMG